MRQSPSPASSPPSCRTQRTTTIQTSMKRYLHRLHVEDVVQDRPSTPLLRRIGLPAVIFERQAAPPFPRCQAAPTTGPVRLFSLRPRSPPIPIPQVALPLLLLRALDAHILAGIALQLFVAVRKPRLLLTHTGVTTSCGKPSPTSVPLRHCQVFSRLPRLFQILLSVATGPHAATKAFDIACSPSWTRTTTLLLLLVHSHLPHVFILREPSRRPPVLPFGLRRVSTRRTRRGTNRCRSVTSSK